MISAFFPPIMDIKEVPKMSRTVRVLTNMSILAEPIQFYKSFFSVPKSPDIVTNYLYSDILMKEL